MSTAQRRSRRLLWFAAASVALLVGALVLGVDAQDGRAPAPHLPLGGGPIDVGPTPAGLSAVDAASCAECHEGHGEDWRGSAHHRSATNEVYRTEFSHRGSPSCTRCHAPRGEAEAGVDCAACHVRDGAVLNPSVSGRAPHASRVAPELSGVTACARCHEFDFDHQAGTALQQTVTEWRQSGHAEVSCQGCHMRLTGGRHGHGGIDEALLERALEVRSVSARHTQEGVALHLDLENTGAGHAIPTGDIFRRLVVRAWPTGRPGASVSVQLARRLRAGRDGWRELGDERVPPEGSRHVAIQLEPSRRRTRTVDYRVEIWRVPPGLERRFRASAGWMRRPLASGRVTVTH